MTGMDQSVILTGTKGISARLTVRERYDPLENTSDVQLSVEVTSAVYGGHIYYLTGMVAAQGQTLQAMSAYAGSHYVYLEKTGLYYPVMAGDSAYTGSPWSLNGIRHETDGSKTITIDVQLTGQEAEGRGANGWQIHETVQLALTHIPRASTIAATDAHVEAVSMVAVNRKSGEYTHSIRYQFGSLSGYLTEEGVSDQEARLTQTAIPFTIPQAFYSQIPTAKSGSCTLVCKTYWGQTQVGEEQSCVFTVTANPALCAPRVTGTVKDGNPNTVALTGDENVLVRYASNAVCTITADARNGAQVTQKSIGGMTISGNTRTIAAIERNGVHFFARDSRGYTGEYTVQKTMIPYVNLTCHLLAKRTDPTSGRAVLTVTGDCYFGSFGAAENELTLAYRIGNGSWQPMAVQKEENTYWAQAELSQLSYTASYPIEVQAQDRLQNVTKSMVLGKGVPVFDWGENDFAFHVPVYLSEKPRDSSQAASKAYADEKLSIVKLWQNPDPTAEFPAQTVAVDLQGCAFVCCAAVAKAGTQEYQLSSLVENKVGNAGHINSFSADDTDFWLNWRRFSVAYNGIRFDGAYMRDMKNNTVYEDWRARSVPVAIYGIRGSVS